MPDTPAAAPAAAQPAAPAKAAAPKPAPAPPAKPAKAEVERVTAIIRNGLSNGPISQSQSTWEHLLTRLPQIVAAILNMEA